MKKLSWGILGTGNIARKFAGALKESPTGELVAVGSRTEESARKFAVEQGVERAHGSYDGLIGDAGVDTVYISLPNHLHAEWSVRCARAGKHVLCEKPMAVNHGEAMAMIEAARDAGVFFMEAFMYRCHPQTARLVRLVREGAVGEVRLIEARFSYHMARDLGNIRLRHDAAGGAIMDVGCYCASMVRLIAGAARGLPCAEPVEVGGSAHIGAESRVDEYAVGMARFPGDILATMVCGSQLQADNTVHIWGSEGDILVPSPWFPGTAPESARILLRRRGKPAEEITVPGDRAIYAIEADTVARHFSSSQAATPAMTWEDSLGNQHMLDRWRMAAGMVFDSEKLAAPVPTIDRGPLRVKERARMPYGRIGGLDKPVSRIVLGTMLEGSTLKASHAMHLFDEFFRHGGNAFDSAFVYRTEPFLGKWIRERGLRDRVVVIAKAAAESTCTPAQVESEMLQTLERLGVGPADVFLLHRDNPDVPAGEFVDLLERHREAGRFAAYGGSNWTSSRIEEANAWARARGKQGFTALSNQLSLARMLEPVWPGCVTMGEPASRRWLREHGITHLAWSSQARGFFSGKASPQYREDPELARCWYSENNFARLERATEFGQRHGFEPIQVALAWVLAQPFESYALCGPHTLAELRSSLRALEVDFGEGDLDWLDPAGQPPATPEK